DGGVIDSGVLTDATGVAAMGIGVLVADRFLPKAMREVCGAAGVEVVAPEFDPIACAEIADRFGPVDPAQLVPMYPREPEAVTKWRLLHGSPKA
ncbi:MAG: hypothetical protein ACOYN0_11130, partial [Phycisphaerales bacterium]